jgi:hypothetical protein
VEDGAEVELAQAAPVGEGVDGGDLPVPDGEGFRLDEPKLGDDYETWPLISPVNPGWVRRWGNVG